MWVPIHYGAYAINERKQIKRIKPAMGTWPGRKLHPYYPTKTATEPYVSLHYRGVRRQVPVRVLWNRAFSSYA